MELEFDVKVNASVLYDYMLHHTYTGFSGLFGSLVGALLVVLFGFNGNIYFLAGGAVILLYIPISLYLRAKKQASLNPAFQKPLHYQMNDEGITVSQGEYCEVTKWEAVQKAVSTTRGIFIYTSPVNAWIFPKKDLAQKKDDVIHMIAIHISPNKNKIRQ